jgi:SAM-dependent methyltransferase
VTIDEAVERCLAIQGWKTRDELVWMAQQAQRSRVVIDVGCWRGRTTKLMAPLLRPRGIVIAVDHLNTPYTGETARNEILKAEGSLRILEDFMSNLKQEIADGQVHAVFMDPDECREEVRSFRKALVDFCWLDGDHAYEDVVADIKAYLPLMRPGGIFAGHDYEKAFPGVMRAVNELIPLIVLGPGTTWFYRVPKEG